MNNFKRLLVIMLAALLTLTVIGCGQKDTVSEVSNGKFSLKIGIMPAVDSAPILLADQKGYFTELGLNVDVQIYTNATNRQSALQSGELDGAMTDVIALVNNVENGFDIKVTTSTDGVFPFLIRKGFEEKKDIKAGMMEVSVTNYLSDRSLGDKYNVEKVYINEIPARLEMISKGTLDMAVVPEPMASQGELNGLTKKLIENNDEFSPDIMVFTGKAIKNNEKAIKLFHDTYNKAVEEINKDDGEVRNILIETLKLKPEIKDKIIMPKYNKARVPDEKYLQGIMDWNEKVLKKKVNLKYEDLVEGKFVK
jgi:NitT/TauT family transport system substrate-binding protein